MKTSHLFSFIFPINCVPIPPPRLPHLHLPLVQERLESFWQYPSLRRLRLLGVPQMGHRAPVQRRLGTIGVRREVRQVDLGFGELGEPNS